MISRTVLAVGVFLIANAFQPTYAQVGTNAWPKPRPLGASIPAYKPPADTAATAATVPSEELRTLSLGNALALALANNPGLAARGWEVRAAEGRILQSGLMPNPEIGLEIENFGGSAERRGFVGAEATLQLSQLVELAGKRTKRQRVAKAGQVVTGWEYESERLEVYTATTKAFFNVLVAQTLVELRQRQLELAGSVLETVRERVAAGRVSQLEETKARVEASGSRIALQRARRDLDTAHGQLVATWGGSPGSFSSAEGSLDALVAPPPLGAILLQLSENPDVRRWEAENALRRSELALEQARQVPDVTVSVGVRRYEDTDDNAVVAGISIPLPLFGLNPGGVLEAERRLPLGQALGEAAIVEVTRAARQAHNALSAVYSELRSLTDEILPGAEEAYEAAQTGYREGRFGLLDVLDAQRTLFEARTRHVESLGAYHGIRADLEHLTGQALSETAAASR